MPLRTLDLRLWSIANSSARRARVQSETLLLERTSVRLGAPILRYLEDIKQRGDEA